MLYTIIKESSYQDSVNLMLLTNKVSAMPGVIKAQIMMGTPANKDILSNAGLYTTELDNAAANDMCIALDVDEEAIIETVLEEINNYLSNQTIAADQDVIESVRSWEKAVKNLPSANIALISVPGSYAAME